MVEMGPDSLGVSLSLHEASTENVAEEGLEDVTWGTVFGWDSKV